MGPKKSNRVIPLFVQNLVVKDTGELEAARKLLEEEKRLRKQVGGGEEGGGMQRVRFAGLDEAILYEL